MIIEKSLDKCRLTLEADALPKDKRTVKVFQRLIAAMRAAEAEVIKEKMEADRELNVALNQNLVLQDENRKLSEQLRKLRLGIEMSSIDALTVAERERMLVAATSNGQK